MTDIRFQPMGESDMPELERWHEETSVSERYGKADWPRKLLDFAQKDPLRTCWVAWESAQRIGYIDCESNGTTAWIGIVVNPALHDRGYGQRMLRSFVTTSHVNTVREFRAGIEADHEMSLRCFQGAGFTPIDEQPDEEGIINVSMLVS